MLIIISKTIMIHLQESVQSVPRNDEMFQYPAHSLYVVMLKVDGSLSSSWGRPIAAAILLIGI